MRYQSTEEKYTSYDLNNLKVESTMYHPDIVQTLLGFCGKETLVNMYWMAKCNLVECYLNKDSENRYARVYAITRDYLKYNGWYEGVDEELDKRGSYLC